MSVTIAMVGDRMPDHPSHRELDAVRGMLGQDVVGDWVATDSDRVTLLCDFDGIWLLPGSPYADDAAAYEAVRWAREIDVPFLGSCAGLQYAVVEYFRNVLGVASASHAEADGIAEADARGVRIAVAVVDVRGEPIQLDTMDGAPTAAPFVAEAVAAGAATFQLPSAEIDPAVTSVLPYRVLAAPGGAPVREGDRVVAGLGVAGADAGICEEIAGAVLG